MEEKDKKILNANQMVGELLLNLIMYGAIFFIIYRIIYGIIYKKIVENEQYILLAFIVIALQSCVVIATFKLANRRAFKKGNIYKEDVKKVISNIAFVIIVILLIQVIGMFANVENSINESLENNFALQYHEHILSYLYDEEQMTIYQVEKEKAIEELKTKMYQYLAVVETGICAVYITAIFLEKRYLYNKAR